PRRGGPPHRGQRIVRPRHAGTRSAAGRNLGPTFGVSALGQAAARERTFHAADPGGGVSLSARPLNRLAQYALLMRLHRPVGIFLLLWPTLWGLWFASQGRPNLHVLTVFVLGVVLMRWAGCVLNDYADRAFDP